MNVLVVCQHYYPEPYRLSDLCESLVQKGHSITVLTGLPNYPEGRIYDGYQKGEKREELINGVKVVRSFIIPRGKNNFMLFLNYVSFTIFASIKAFNMKDLFDVIFVHQTSPVMMAVPAIVYKKRYQKKILLYCGDPWPDSLAAGGIREGSLVYKLFWYISKWIYMAADRIMVTSYMFKGYFRDTFGMDFNKTEYLPPYAEDYFIDSAPYGFDDDHFNLVFAGNIGKAQSVETIILAANELKENKSIVFHILGSGSNLSECEKLSAKYKLKNVLFYGRLPIEEMSEYYRRASAMLVTLKDSKSFSCTLPSKVQTYMAAARPIIGAVNGETRRVIEESGCGFCCASGDYQGLADIIIKFCKDKRKKEMAAKSRAYYDRFFSKERFMNALESALAELGESDSV